METASASPRPCRPGTGPVGTAVGAALPFGERLSVTTIAGIATVIVGTTLINLGANAGG